MARTVSRLSITPVKSTALTHPDQVMLERFGVAENRRFYAINRNGRLLNAARHGELLAVRSRWEPALGRLTLRFPDGAEVSEKAGKLRPDVVVMDINMPEMDGIKAAEILSTELPGIGIIMMSVQSEQDYLRRAMLAGAREFLVKPCSGDDLIRSIRHVYRLEASKRALAAAARSGGGGYGTGFQFSWRWSARRRRPIPLIASRGNGHGR